jgi:histidinol phosphatase-like PHP family hydrolase
MHSDGELGPAELFRRAEVAGLGGVCLTDHADASNVERMVEAALRACEAERRFGSLACAAGVELTHVRPAQIGELVRRARDLGAGFVVVHGESPVEPVEPGTNRAAVEAGCDLLAHPGLVDPGTARLAGERGVLLEISGKRGHSLANGHVASAAREAGAALVYGGDCHLVSEIRAPEAVVSVLRAAGLSAGEAEAALASAREALERAASRRGP